MHGLGHRPLVLDKVGKMDNAGMSSMFVSTPPRALVQHSAGMPVPSLEGMNALLNTATWRSGSRKTDS